MRPEDPPQSKKALRINIMRAALRSKGKRAVVQDARRSTTFFDESPWQAQSGEAAQGSLAGDKQSCQVSDVSSYGKRRSTTSTMDSNMDSSSTGRSFTIARSSTRHTDRSGGRSGGVVSAVRGLLHKSSGKGTNRPTLSSSQDFVKQRTGAAKFVRSLGETVTCVVISGDKHLFAAG